MATTGQDLRREFWQSIDKAYSNYYDNAKLNTLFFRTFINVAEIKYRSLDSQKEYDEITSLIRSEKTYSINNNRIFTKPITINSIVYAPTTATISSVFPHNLVAGDQVTISGVQGITGPINATFIVSSVVNDYSFVVNVSGISGSYTALSGNATSPKLIQDYTHLLTLKCRYLDPVRYQNVRVKNVIQDGIRTIIELNRRTDLRNADQVTISGVIGFAAANGQFYVKQLSAYKYQLFVDELLLTPLTPTGAQQYIEGGEISKTRYNYATQYYSDQKISTFDDPSVQSPKFEISDGFIKLYPKNFVCDQITIDYVSIDTDTPIVRIDVNDNTLNLENFYPKKFLVRLVEEAALLFNKDSRDLEQYQFQKAEIVDNP